MPSADFSVRRFKSLEGLRGYMAWWVVAGHAIQVCGLGGTLPHAVEKILLQGSTAVNVFIILSGFVVTHLILDKREPYRLYILRRGFRIIPVYFFCLLLAIAARPAFELTYTGNWVASRAWAAGSLEAASDQFLAHLMLHLTLMHGALPDSLLQYSSSTFLGPAWSMSLEWQFYLLAPFIASLLRMSNRVRIAAMAACIVTALVFRSGSFGTWKFPSMLLLSMPFFMIGMLCRLSLDAIEKIPSAVLAAAVVMASLLLPAIRLELLIWSLFLAAALKENSAAQHHGRLLRSMLWITANRAVSTLGKASYSTYLVHMPFWSIVIWAGYRLFGLHGQGATIVLTLVSLVALVPVSLLLYRFIERPFIKWGATIGRAENQHPLVPAARPLELPRAALRTEKI